MRDPWGLSHPSPVPMPCGLVTCLQAVPLDPDPWVLLPLIWHLLSGNTGHLSLGLDPQPPLPGSGPKPRPHFGLTSLNWEMMPTRPPASSLAQDRAAPPPPVLRTLYSLTSSVKASPYSSRHPTPFFELLKPCPFLS